MYTQKISVLVADDDPLVRAGWEHILEDSEELTLVAVAHTPLEIPSLALKHRPDVVLVDLHWHGDETAGASAIRRLRKAIPSSKIIAVTVHSHLIPKAREAGADAAVLRLFSYSELVRIIESVINSEDNSVVHASPQESLPVLNGILSKRENEVLPLIAEGLTDQEIAEKLHISLNTVKHHVGSILSKFAVKNRVAAADIARKRGLLR